MADRRAKGPPGETEILRLNPQRESMIRTVTGWETLAPGSLNLVVDDSVVERLGEYKPKFEESASGIVYPSPYEGIPKLRKALIRFLAGAFQDLLGSQESAPERLRAVAQKLLALDVRL